MENTAPVLLVTNRKEWEKQYGQYKRKAKRLRAIHGLLAIPCIGALAYLAGVLYPLIRGDIAFGHPSYYEYRAAADMAIVLFAASFVPYLVAGFFFTRWIRTAHLALGLQADGNFVEVREVFNENGLSIAESSRGDLEGSGLETSRYCFTSRRRDASGSTGMDRVLKSVEGAGDDAENIQLRAV